jgi:hypothetical protein
MASIDEAVTESDVKETEIEFLFSRIEYLTAIFEFGTLDVSEEIEGKLMTGSDTLLRLKKLVWFLRGFRLECASTITAIEDRIQDVV